MELDGATSKANDLRPEHRKDGPELTVSVHEEVEIPAVYTRKRHGKHQQSLSTRRDGCNPFGRSPSSCNRHLRRSRARASPKNNQPQALVDSEMEMGLAQGSRVAEKAMRAVKQANAQVCFANLEVILMPHALLALAEGYEGYRLFRRPQLSAVVPSDVPRLQHGLDYPTCTRKGFSSIVVVEISVTVPN